eukprot:1161140-Pelagomonas_calceolata.AAC.12
MLCRQAKIGFEREEARVASNKGHPMHLLRSFETTWSTFSTDDGNLHTCRDLSVRMARSTCKGNHHMGHCAHTLHTCHDPPIDWFSQHAKYTTRTSYTPAAICHEDGKVNLQRLQRQGKRIQRLVAHHQECAQVCGVLGMLQCGAFPPAATWTADSRSGRLMEAHDWEGQGAERQHGQQTAGQGASWRHMIGRVKVQRDNMGSRQQIRAPHGGT